MMYGGLMVEPTCQPDEIPPHVRHLAPGAPTGTRCGCRMPKESYHGSFLQ
jgi:hypothetical protein